MLGVTAGPGMTNAMTASPNAHVSRAPVLAATTATACAHNDRDVARPMIIELFGPREQAQIGIAPGSPENLGRFTCANQAVAIRCPRNRVNSTLPSSAES
jgi:hypothetical protein